jgi:glycosyltransferase involved in cell wall biosynthesis
VALLKRAFDSFRQARTHPRVVILAKGGLGHNAHVRKSARSLHDAGFDVFVLGAKRRGMSEQPAWVQQDGFRLLVVPLPEASRAASRSAAADPYELARYEAAWWPLVRELRPDVVHAFDVSGLSVARRAGERGARWIYEAHEATRHCTDGPRDEARRRQVTEHAAHADGLVAFTAQLGRIVMDELRPRREPTIVHCTPPLQAGPPPPIGLRQAAGLGPDEPLIVFSGLLTRRRRLDVVLEAMTLLPEVRLALVASADDPLMRGLLARGAELGVSDRVHVVPKVPPESVVPYLAGADVGVIPYERSQAIDISLPNKLFEYLHAGLPIVTSDATATVDFVRRHGLGEVAPLDDTTRWASAITRALQPPRYRDRAADWRALREKWCWERQAEGLVALYRNVLAERAA